MKILSYKSGHVDLEAPIWMTQGQFDEFSKFFEENFPTTEFVEKEEMVKKMGTKEVDYKDWTIEDYLLLLEPSDNSSLASKMKRTRWG